MTNCKRALFPGRIADLMVLYLTSTNSSYNGHFYEQQDGAAKGFPVLAAVANLHIKFFGNLVLNSAPVRSRVWRRCVDDIFCI